MTRQEFTRAMNALEENYQVNFSKIQVDLIWSRVQTYDYAVFRQAVLQIMEAETVLPKNPLPLFLRYLGEYLDESLSEQYYRQMLKKLRRIGMYNSPTEQVCRWWNIDPPTETERQIISELGGWVACCQMSDEDFKWAIKNLFHGGYRPNRTGLPQLTGLHEQENRALQAWKQVQEILEQSDE